MVISQDKWSIHFQITKVVRHSIKEMAPLLQYYRQNIPIHSIGIVTEHKGLTITYRITDRRFGIWNVLDPVNREEVPTQLRRVE